MISLAQTLLNHDGLPGLGLVLLACLGAGCILSTIASPLVDRIELFRDGRWHPGVIWYRPHRTALRGGQPWIVVTWHKEDPYGTWVLAFPDDDSDEICPEWIPLAELTPGPSRRERRGNRTVAA